MTNEDNEEAKKILKEYKQLMTRKRQLLDLINSLEHDIQSCKSPNLESNLNLGNSQSISSKIAFLVDLKQQLSEIIVQLNSKILIIEQILMKVAVEQTLGANVLHYKFIDLCTLEEISVLIGYSYPQTIRIYNSALKCFYIKFQEEKQK